MFSKYLAPLILRAARQPKVTLGVVALLVCAALVFISSAFTMTTDTGQLISAQTPWRQNEAAVEHAFPQLQDTIVLIIDGQTPELAGDGADRLAAALAADPAHFKRVSAPGGGDYFARQGMLFAPLAEVTTTTRQLIDAQPLLGALAADPTLHGVAKALDTAATGAATTSDTAATARLTAPMTDLSSAIDAKLDGKPTYFSWTRLFSNGKGQLAPPTRRLLLVQPNIDFSAIEPGAMAVAAVQAHAAKLQLDSAHGVRLGITGEVPLADEEFGSIRENIGLVGLLMAAAMLLTLWFATESWREVLAIMGTTLAGLVITLALGLLAVGRLNLISVAFIPLFVGLGVDFGIQVGVRFNAERREGADPLAALEHMGLAIGKPLLTAAAAIFLALGAFLPTAYIGIAELGVISGMGMVIALVLNITMLPALLIVLKPPVPSHQVGWSQAAPIDRWLERNRKRVLVSFVLAMVGSMAMMPWVVFDFNPLHLRNMERPAMQALTALMHDAERTPNTIVVLAPNITAANKLAARLSKLPEVAQAITLDSFIPADQPPKLALIEDAALLLDPAINPFDLPPPSDAATTSAALAKAQVVLRQLASARPGPLGHAAGALAASFARLERASPDQRTEVATMLTAPLAVTLNSLRSSLTASAVSRNSLPPDLRADWMAKDGRARIELTPSGNSLDNATLVRFTAAVRSIAPQASGVPVATQEAARTVAMAFIQAGVLALILVSLLLYFVLRSLREVGLTLAPVVLSVFLTLGSCVVIGQPLNFANIIAFPLLLGVGVAFHIYFVMAWDRGVTNLLQTSLARAVVFSGLATGSAFGALRLSGHPGTASMGLILMISLVWTLICALIFEPALLGPPLHDAHREM